VNVVIYSDGQRRVGLVVDRIIDIIDDAITTELVGARKGVIGSALIQGRVTELVDVVEAILCIDPTFPISAPDFPGWSEDARP
jgi:two-component system chemotaxis sensor kinase CheA